MMLGYCVARYVSGTIVDSVVDRKTKVRPDLSQIDATDYHRLIGLRNAPNYARYVDTGKEDYAECFFYSPAAALVGLIRNMTDLLPSNPAIRIFSES